LGASELVLKLDSELVVKQLRGEYKIKHASLKPLAERARELIQAFDRFDIMHVPRDQTKAADKLANDELDGKDAS
jgi:ribonuclease HI